MRYQADYTTEAEALYDNDVDNDVIVEQLVARFELEFATELQGLQREDVGAVMLYTDANGEEAAFFDYELYVGSIYALGGKRADELA
jgi:hypothetical protein